MGDAAPKLRGDAARQPLIVDAAPRDVVAELGAGTDDALRQIPGRAVEEANGIVITPHQPIAKPHPSPPAGVRIEKIEGRSAQRISQCESAQRSHGPVLSIFSPEDLPFQSLQATGAPILMHETENSETGGGYDEQMSFGT